MTAATTPAPDARTRTRMRGVPRLASDIWRSFAALAIVLPLFFVLGFVLGFLFVDEVRSDELAFDALTISAALFGWALFSVIMIVLTWLVFRRADPEELRRWLAATTPEGRLKRFVWAANGGGGISWAITGSALALVAILLLALNAEYRTQPLPVVAAISVVVTSVLLIISAYAVHYARQDVRSTGLAFPADTRPGFADYFYLSAQVATTFSSSDVDVVSTGMRRAVTVHSLISFAFNTVIVALFVSLLIAGVS